jgi:hypothetical protein
LSQQLKLPDQWDKYVRKHWEIEGVVSLASAPLARVFRAIIQCDGKVHDSFCMEKYLGFSKLKFDNRYCGVQLIISLPVGAEEEFEKLSKCKLREATTVKF